MSPGTGPSFQNHVVSPRTDYVYRVLDGVAHPWLLPESYRVGRSVLRQAQGERWVETAIVVSPPERVLMTAGLRAGPTARVRTAFDAGESPVVD